MAGEFISIESGWIRAADDLIRCRVIGIIRYLRRQLIKIADDRQVCKLQVGERNVQRAVGYDASIRLSSTPKRRPHGILASRMCLP